MTPDQRLSAPPEGAVAAGGFAHHRLSIALFWWMGVCVLASCVAAAAGADHTPAAAAAALALAPATATLIVMPRWGETWAQVLSIFSWLSFACIAVSLSGGPVSPALPALALGPALALWTGRRERVVEATLFALLAYMAAGAASTLASLASAPPVLGPLPSFLGVIGLAFSGALMAAHPWRRAAAVVVTPAPVAAAAPEAPAGGSPSTLRIAELGHELRTPLTHMIGFAEMMERQVFGPLHDRYRDYAGVIRTSGGHLLSVVNDMLDLSRLEEGARRLDIARFDARDIAREVIASARGGADQKGVRLTLETPATPLLCDADATALRQILFNIVSNAVKFSPTGGAARLTVRAEEKALILETADTGPGIPAEERARLGQRFVRGEGSSGVEGLGLGLAIVKGLAGLHGGGLSFGEAPEGGALVRVSLPVLAGEA